MANKRNGVAVGKRKKNRVRISAPKKDKEMTRLGAALRYLGGLGGGAVGSMIGMPSSGANVGHGLGAAVSKWLGSGDYSVGTNSVVGSSLKASSGIPAMHNNGQTVVVRHKEFVTEVRGSQAFKVVASFDLNPGRNETFPWLAGVASRFQEYRIKGLVWHYVPSSGSAVSGTNAALGTVMLQTSYRSNDTPPSNKNEVLNEYWSSESVPSEAFCHPIECDPKENPFNVQYVRTDSVPVGDSKLLYDLGQTHLCVAGQQIDDAVLGDLWCTYEIELKKPIIESNVTSTARAGALRYTESLSTLSLFNGTPTTLGTLDVTANGRTVTFPPQLTGVYLVVLQIAPATNFTSADLSGTTVCTNCSQLPLVGGSTYFRSTTNGTFTGGQQFYMQVVQILDKAKQASITYPNFALTGTIASTTVSVAPYNVYN